MKNLIKRPILMGMGAVSITRERAEKFARELEEKGEVTSEEARQFADELVQKGEQERANFKDTVKREVDSLLRTAGLVTKKEFDQLESRVRQLELQEIKGEKENGAAGRVEKDIHQQV
ncbi:phasin family protein [Phosphitispora fastidiosa]|uniref:phasin family protein n=1 Tax=Phosphitispora fastidiosa TaxID=2837202 RepID=UPI001E50F49F|nr:hypothetical protein [Phosphitispora fastidiosa]MBU7007019.1 polyhydroxyalkanoate synthesis regulator phasin [Phosphitispora fastidiosa]